MEKNTNDGDRYAYIAPCFGCGTPVIGYASKDYAIKHEAPQASICGPCGDKLEKDINKQ